MPDILTPAEVEQIAARIDAGDVDDLDLGALVETARAAARVEPTPDTTRQGAEALVEDYERRVSTDLLERDWLVDQIATFAAARVAAVTETAITAMEQADAALVEINPWNYDAVDVARQNESVIEASRILREAIGALRGGPPAPGAGTPWSDAPMDHTPTERAAGREGAR